MSCDPFEAVREQVTAQDAARHYGLNLDRRGWALCPFHPDHKPSMSFKGGRFRCWVCGASGDAVDLVRGLFGGTYWEALQRINMDFGLGLALSGEITPQQRAEAIERKRIRELHQRFERWRADTINQLTACIRAANAADWANLTPQEEEAIRQRERLEAMADTLSHGTPAEQMQLFRDRKRVSLSTSSILATSKKK
ncbi:CHC2 zinc finger domain-containing protein [Flavonifractor sp. An306]|uniref:CHC2 zinc finger domain-containing protein n=1 Tax=Flavonifractor sp. An306 TaxID=1965629 RepID=UPI00174D6413|nr:CHC2 zinc finger domain-containing protein [Flavonifractor sp. An306]